MRLMTVPLYKMNQNRCEWIAYDPEKPELGQVRGATEDEAIGRFHRLHRIEPPVRSDVGNVGDKSSVSDLLVEIKRLRSDNEDLRAMLGAL